METGNMLEQTNVSAIMQTRQVNDHPVRTIAIDKNLPQILGEGVARLAFHGFITKENPDIKESLIHLTDRLQGESDLTHAAYISYLDMSNDHAPLFVKGELTRLTFNLEVIMTRLLTLEGCEKSYDLLKLIVHESGFRIIEENSHLHFDPVMTHDQGAPVIIKQADRWGAMQPNGEVLRRPEFTGRTLTALEFQDLLLSLGKQDNIHTIAIPRESKSAIHHFVDVHVNDVEAYTARIQVEHSALLGVSPHIMAGAQPLNLNNTVLTDDQIINLFIPEEHEQLEISGTALTLSHDTYNTLHLQTNRADTTILEIINKWVTESAPLTQEPNVQLPICPSYGTMVKAQYSGETVITLHNMYAINNQGEETPLALEMQFLIRNSKLHKVIIWE